MAKTTPRKEPDRYVPIRRISVEGFKSIADKQSIEIRPLTVLAGANSSGKSSMMQPLLLLKQTLEATYDPGVLKLDGPIVRFSDAEQMFSRAKGSRRGFAVGVDLLPANGLRATFEKTPQGKLEIGKIELVRGREVNVLTPGMSAASIDALPFVQYLQKRFPGFTGNWQVERRRCFLELRRKENGAIEKEPSVLDGFLRAFDPDIPIVESLIQHVIHVPGLRGHPERVYPTTAMSLPFPGTFPTYVASIIAMWEANRWEEAEALNADLSELGLTWKIESKRLDDTRIELNVARLPKPLKSRDNDLVNIADVGFGVSQVLPVLVALLAAPSGLVVYLEQPEIHLHPRAQVALAGMLCRAAQRGVRVIVETHSNLLLLGIQSQVARAHLPSKDVVLHWFVRSEKDGATQVRSAEMDEAGRYGDWPVDFGDVELDTDTAYLEAAESQLRK